MTTKPVVESPIDEAVALALSEFTSLGDKRREAAQDFRDILDAAGYVIAPKEPSEKMHLEFTDRMRLSHRLGYSDFCMGYYAMIAAAAAEDQS